MASTVLGTGAVQQQERGKGVQKRARWAEIQHYYDDALYRRFVGSGRATFLGASEYHTDGSSRLVTCRVSGKTTRVRRASPSCVMMLASFFRAWTREFVRSDALRKADPAALPSTVRRTKSMKAWACWISPMLVAALWSAPAEAQAPAKMLRIGMLSPGAFPEQAPPWGVPAHLTELGYVDGRNVVFERRAAAGRPERLPELAGELVSSKVDIIVAFTNPAAFAAKNATSSIPIVVWAAHGAIDTGLVSSLARPGGNVTGVESLAPEIDAKRMQILKEIVPGLAKVGVLYSAHDQGSSVHLRSVRAAARILHVEVVPLEVRRVEDVHIVFPATKTFDALLTFTDAWLTSGPHWKHAADYALAHRIPTMCEFGFYARLYGCLLAYGSTFDEFSRRNAQQIDHILKGAKAGDLPFEQVTRFPMVVNRKTAAAIGVTIPQSVILRADEVIE